MKAVAEMVCHKLGIYVNSRYWPNSHLGCPAVEVGFANCGIHDINIKNVVNFDEKSLEAPLAASVVIVC